MKRANIILVPLIAFSACKQKPMTLEEMQKAKWDSLSKGVDYISIEDEKRSSFKNDSIEIKLKGVAGIEVKAEMSFDKIQEDMSKMFSDMLKLRLPDSKAGYLRINLYKMMKPEVLSGRIELRGDYNPPSTFSSDSIDLKNISGIKTVRFISKEAAKQEYLADGNGDWDKVLSFNPLPNNIEIKLDDREWTDESLNDLKNLVLGKLIMPLDVIFPTTRFNKSDEIFFFEYNRK
jgi:FtsX extracellular domain